MKVAIHRVERKLFVIVKWEDDLFKWDGYSFQELGYESAKSFDSEKEVVAACKDCGFTVEALLTGLPKKKEDEVWDKVQALLEA
jgi:hypothetical protein